jgi:hypothetical protein
MIPKYLDDSLVLQHTDGSQRLGHSGVHDPLAEGFRQNRVDHYFGKLAQVAVV